MSGDLYRFGGARELIAENIVTITHDMVPPSMHDFGVPIKLRDMHGRKRGLTAVVQLQSGRPVTLAGVDRDLMNMWCCTGEVLWTKDTAEEQGIDQRRNSVGIKVNNAEKVAKSQLNEHQVMSYGSWSREMALVCSQLGLKLNDLDR